MAALTPEQKKNYDDMVNGIKGHDNTVDQIFDASLLAGFLLGVTALTVPRIVRLLDTGAIVAAADLVARGFVRILNGAVAEGAAMIGAGLRTGRLLATYADMTAEASRFVRIFRAGAKVLAAVSVVLDGVLLIYQAIEGAKQRTALQNGIIELFSRRQNVKTLEMNVFAVESFQGEIQGYLTTADILTDGPSKDAVLAQYEATIVQHVTDAQSQITDDIVYNTLKSQDTLSGAWTNEDPTLQQALAWIASQPDDDSTS